MGNTHKTVLLIITGGIAAYRALELIRLLRKAGHCVHPVLTKGAQAFITPLSAAALAGEKAHTELFSLTEETEMGHIRLARAADVVVVAPATADFIARAAHGLADDLATTLLLAASAPVLMAPAMNPHMWRHPATRRNVAQLKADGVHVIGPATGAVACGEEGEGRMAEPADILARLRELLAAPGDAIQESSSEKSPAGEPVADRPLAGRRVLITAGPTHEPIDPVRVLANRSSGRMGYALAEAARELGADVVLISGPVALAPPAGVNVRRVETAREMLHAVEAALAEKPVDLAVFAAAVADWRVKNKSAAKMKKGGDGPPLLELEENPDILAMVARTRKNRPKLVVGFAAETENVLENARAKLRRKGADVMVANDVSPDSGILGGEETELVVITADGEEHHLPRQPKPAAARALLRLLAQRL